MRRYLAIPKIRIHNANAMSSGYTIGFPAMTAWLGAMHALQRRLRKNGFEELLLEKIVISCHECDLQVYKYIYDSNFSIVGMAKPLRKKKKSFDFEPASFIEEPRCNLDVTILIELDGYNPDDVDILINSVKSCLHHMRIAGGDIESKNVQPIVINDAEYSQFRKKVNQLLMPGVVLVERQDLFNKFSGKDNLDSLLKALSVKVSVERNEKNKIVGYKRKKLIENSGWLVPAVVGFKDLTGKMNVANQRDDSYEHHFVEPLVTLGEFIMPYQCENIDSLMWYYDYDKVNGLYLCRNNYIND